jgi:hypothetical protein
MPLRCPLCLAPVTAGTRFQRVCSTHGTSSGLAKEVIVGEEAPEELLERMRCPYFGCLANLGIVYPAVYLSHVGCEEGKNPLAGVGSAETGTHSFSAPHPRSGASSPVGHWQTGLENLLLKSFAPGARPAEMFFPAALLRATGRPSRAANRSQVGVLVELSGPTKVGKTLLAMQALDAQGYEKRITKLVGHLAGDFIYCSPELPGSSTPGRTYLQILKMRELMAKNELFDDWLDATPERPRSIKAVFFSRSKALVTAKEPPKGIRGELANSRDLVRVMLKRAMGSAGASTDSSVVVFYDLAGETSEAAAHIRTREHEANVDVLAVVVEFPQVTCNPPDLGDVIGRLREAGRFKEARGRGVRCCLVVTKLDLLDSPALDATFREVLGEVLGSGLRIAY